MRQRFVALFATAAFALIVTPAYAGTGAYLQIASWQPIEDSMVMGPENVPQVPYKWGIEDNPVTVAQWGLQNWSWWTQDGEQQHLDKAIRAADWLIAHQRGDGAWEYTFAFIGMEPPWISGLAQGQAISMLVRAYSYSGAQGYLDAAIAALGPLHRDVAQGGVVDDWDGLPWYEEYPLPEPQHVLNGFEFTLIGLNDLAPHSDDAQQLFDAGITSLVARIGVFDAPSAHSQYYGAIGTSRRIVKGGYPRYHAELTRELATLTGSSTLSDYAARWERYLLWRPPVRPAPPPAPAEPLPVAPASAPCRFRDNVVRMRGGVSCRRARITLRRYLRSGRSPGRWRCRTGRRVICRQGAWRISAPPGRQRAR